MKFKNPFKKIKNKVQNLKKPRYTELQTKYLACKKASKHLKELQAINLQLPTKDLQLEIQQLDKKFVELDMEFISFYEEKRKKVLSGFQKELDKVTTDD